METQKPSKERKHTKNREKQTNKKVRKQKKTNNIYDRLLSFC